MSSHLSSHDSAMVRRIMARAGCTPPAKNAAAKLDGSAVAGPGVCTPSQHLKRAQDAYALHLDYVNSGLRASADRQRLACMSALWAYVGALHRST